MVGPPVMTAGPITEESELLFFNAVFHLPSSTVDLVVDHLCIPDQIGDHEALGRDTVELMASVPRAKCATRRAEVYARSEA